MAHSTPWYYPVAIKVLKPVYRFVLWRRHKKAQQAGIGRDDAEFAAEIDARFGRAFPEPPISPVSARDNVMSGKTLSSDKDEINLVLPYHTVTIWCHAVSLGETNTIASMIHELLNKGAKIWFTNTTQTGFARAEVLFKDAIDSQQLVHTFVPVDDKTVINKFLEHVNPNLALFVETELWATTLELLAYHNIDAVLVNGRLSEKSYERYVKFEAVSQSMMNSLSLIIAQDEDSAKRFRQLGADAKKIRMADSLKWSTGAPSRNNADANTDKFVKLGFIEDIAQLDRPIWIAGSTHEGEEVLVLQAHQRLLEQSGLDSALLIIVPRHPERFDDVADLLADNQMNYKRRSKNDAVDNNTQVYLADTMGELPLIYQMSDVALVGGSLVDNIGGHNPIEAASFGKPIIMGEYTSSCDELVAELQQAGALKIAMSQGATDDIVGSIKILVADWLLNADDAKLAGEKGAKLVNGRSQAMQKQLGMIEQLLIEKVRTLDSTVKLVVKE